MPNTSILVRFRVKARQSLDVKFSLMIKLKKYFLAQGHELALGELNGKLCLSDWIYSKNIKRKAQSLAKKYKTSYEYKDTPLLIEAARQMDQYFTGRRKEFELPLLLTGTEFQNKVWETLQSIPYGELWSYKQLAAAVGNPEAFRAVANANGKNPLPFIIPCHRVISNNGSIGGYSLGLELKQFLINMEFDADNYQLELVGY